MNKPDEAAVAVQRLRRASQHYLQLVAASCVLVHCGFSEKLGTLGLAPWHRPASICELAASGIHGKLKNGRTRN